MSLNKISDGVYSSGVLKTTPDPIRKISKYHFLARFDPSERIAIRNSSDDNIIDFMHLLDSITSHVDLDLQETINGVNYIDSQGLLTVSTPASVLADGQSHEV